MEDSPIQQLFHNILVDIFQKVVGSGGPNEQPIPFILSQVCSSWREATLSTPSLWAQIWIPRDFAHVSEAFNDAVYSFNPDSEYHSNLYDHDLGTLANISRCIRIMMERAGSVPLFIHYCCQNPDPFENVVFQDLLDQVHRWSEFYFRGSSAHSMFKATCAPLLRVLDFYYI
ncbi:hypothetical protein AMATHDRAFT_42693, partial [Amanita thiersii Skay4041]